MKTISIIIVISFAMLVGCRSMRPSFHDYPNEDGLADSKTSLQSSDTQVAEVSFLPSSSIPPLYGNMKMEAEAMASHRRRPQMSESQWITPSLQQASYVENAPQVSQQAVAHESLELPAPSKTPQRDLELSQLEQMAMAGNPSLARAAAEVEALGGKWEQVGLPPNPTIGYLAEDIGDSGTEGKQGAFVGQEIIRGGKLALSREVVSQEIEQAEQKLAAQQYRVLTDVRVGYFDYLISLRKIKLAQELVDISSKMVRATQELQRKGEVKQAEKLRAEAETATLRILLNNAHNQKHATWNRLAIVIGNPQLEIRQISPEVVDRKIAEVITISINRNKAMDRLLTESPEMAAKMSNVESARWAVQRASAEGVPNLNMQLSVQYDAVSGNTVTGLQLGMPIPYRNWNQGGIRQAQAELVSAEREVEQASLGLQRRFELVFQRYANARNQVEEYGKTDGILDKAKETLRLTALGFEFGEDSSLDLLTAQRIFAQANLAYLDALRELWVAATEIDGLLLKDSFQRMPR